MQQSDSMAATNGLAILQPAVTPHLAALNCSKHIHSITNTQQTDPNETQAKPEPQSHKKQFCLIAATNQQPRACCLLQQIFVHNPQPNHAADAFYFKTHAQDIQNRRKRKQRQERQQRVSMVRLWNKLNKPAAKRFDNSCIFLAETWFPTLQLLGFMPKIQTSTKFPTQGNNQD